METILIRLSVATSTAIAYIAKAQADINRILYITKNYTLKI